MSYSRFPSRFGKYILLDRINSGGMAEVYRAKMTGAEQFQRLVAIKCMLPQLNQDEQFTTMFVDEAKLAAQLSHANIVQIYELGKFDDQLYIAMELVNGRDLRHIIRRAHSSKTPIPLGFAAYVLHKAAEGLDFAHRKHGVDGQPLNLVHRDVSPQNILVSYDGEVKVVDFGIAKAEVRDTETRAGVLKGKFAYMAPEQVMGGSIDRRADIFALGIVLYEVLTGKKLFQGESDFSILEKVRAPTVPQLSGNIADLPPEVDAILQQALVRNPAERFAWASDLAEALAPLLITHRSIFGAKQAKEFIQTLYKEEIAQLGQRLQQYSRTTLGDCLESSTQRRAPREAEVFETRINEVVAAPAASAQPARRDPLAHLQTTGEQPTQLSDVKEASAPRVPPPVPPEAPEPEPAHSGWTGVHNKDRAFGEEFSNSTQLLEIPANIPPPPVEGERTPEPGPAPDIALPPPADPSISVSGVHLHPQPLTHAPSPGIIVAALMAATLVVVAAIVAVIILNRGHQRNANLLVAAPSINTPVAPAGVPPAAVLPTPPTPPTPAPAAVTPVPTPTPVVSSPAELLDADDDDSPPARRKTKRKVERREGKEPREPKEAKDPKDGKMGYVTIKAMGAPAAKVMVDGKSLGYAPVLGFKLKIGSHLVRVIEEAGGKDSRERTTQIKVNADHSRTDPLKVVVTF